MDYQLKDMPFKDWEFKDIENAPCMGLRLYKKYMNDTVIEFYIIECISYSNKNDVWSDGEIQELFSGTIFFDGVTHFGMGDSVLDKDGYLGCPNFNLLRLCFDEIEKLEKSHCDKFK